MPLTTSHDLHSNTLHSSTNVLSRINEKKAITGLLFLTFITMVALQLLNAPLKTAAAPAGIVSFELAGQLPQSLAILDCWQGNSL